MPPSVLHVVTESHRGFYTTGGEFQVPITTKNRMPGIIIAGRDIGNGELGNVVQQALPIAVGSNVTAIKENISRFGQGGDCRGHTG